MRLTGKIGDDISETVKIVPEKKYAFKITGITLSKNENIKYELKESENSGGTEYHLTVSNISKERGRYFDTITIDTDSSVNPKIEIKVFGNIAGNIKE